MNNSYSTGSSSYSFKTEGSPNAQIKNTPLTEQEFSGAGFLHVVSSKKKTTTGDSATIYEVLVVIFCPELGRLITAVWSVWSNQSLFLTMIDQMKNQSTAEKPLLLYTENGLGKNGLYEMLLTHPNKYTTFSKDGKEDMLHTAQVGVFTL